MFFTPDALRLSHCICPMPKLSLTSPHPGPPQTQLSWLPLTWPGWAKSWGMTVGHLKKKETSNGDQIPCFIIHGSLNVPIEHHPTIRYMVYNGYYKVMSNIPKSWDTYQPLSFSGCFFPTKRSPKTVPGRASQQPPAESVASRLGTTDRRSSWPVHLADFGWEIQTQTWQAGKSVEINGRFTLW